MKIYKVPKERKYWVVRAEGGRYFDHFLRFGVVALGHLNSFKIKDSSEGEYFYPDENYLSLSFNKYHGSRDSKRQSTSAKLAQIKTFIYEIQVGDWVLTVGKGGVKYGRIISRPYIRNDPLKIIMDPSEDTFDLDYKLRRDVRWGPGIRREFLPYGLAQSLRANQTVFSLDKNWEAVHHSIYPAFIRENKLYLSARIKSDNQIRNFDVTSIFQILNEIEVIGKEFSKNREITDFSNTYASYIDRNELTITTKAQFHSPGEIWNTITALWDSTNIDTVATYVVMAYSMLFGNQKLGFDGLIDIETRRKLWDIVLERMRKNRAEKAVKNMNMALPDSKTDALEDASHDKLR